MKVIIADDEEKICQLISKLIDWHAYDMTVVAAVHSGTEALDAIGKYRPDIVVTDIRMPGCDGLEMIKQAKEINSETEFIIISGYRHFEYARNAIRYGVKDYLLKPIRKSELSETLSRMREEFLERNKRLSSEELFRITMKKNLDRLRAAFFTEILFKKGAESDSMSIRSINEEYHYNFSEGLFSIVLLKTDGISPTASLDISYIQDKILPAVNKRLQDSCYELESIFEGSMCYIILNFNEENRKNVRRSLKSLLDELLLQKEIFEGMKVTMGIGTIYSGIGGIFDSMRNARYAVEQRIFLGVNRLIEGGRDRKSDFAESELFTRFNTMLTEGVERLNEQQIRIAISEFKTSLRAKDGVDGHDVIQTAREAMNLYYFTMRRNNFIIKDSGVQFERFSANIDDIGSLDGIFDELERVMIISMRKAVEEKSREDYRPIRKAKQYINDHYSEQISLEIVSDAVELNPTYLSSLFKKETGKTFSEYLTETRIEQAKNMIKETAMPVSEICIRVGYNDQKNFNRIFTKYTELKPNEYRKIYS